jgi:hypothetical protein
MTRKNFEIVSYKTSASRSIELGGGNEIYRSDALIQCKGADGERLNIYFISPGSLTPDNYYDAAGNLGIIYVPSYLYEWYRDLLLNEKPLFAFCDSEKPEWNRLSTENELTGETEPPLPNLGRWLTSHSEVGNAIIWESSSGTQAYPDWSASMKKALSDAFKKAWNYASVLHRDPVPNKKKLEDRDKVVQILDKSYAWPMFLSLVAQSLAIEIGRRVGWSIQNYSTTGLAQLFDSRETFRWNGNEGGYEIQSSHGWALPCPPHLCYGFLSNMLGENRYQTIAALLDWCHNLKHYGGVRGDRPMDAILFYKHWHYRGFPPVSSIIEGTRKLTLYPSGVYHQSSEISHYTAGCWGTTGFLRAVLRAVNIPVRLIETCKHAQPHFIEDGLYLSHGDDPYNGLTIATPPMPISEILLNQAQFDDWFGPLAWLAGNQCRNVGRRTVELSLRYLSTLLLKDYCKDIRDRKSHKDGKVYKRFKDFYTVEQLEEMHLWAKMDDKLSSLGGCSNL